MENYDACILEIYQRESGRHYCKVTAGQWGFAGLATPAFRPKKVIYDIPLNGPGRNKAAKKVRSKLKADGLDLLVFKNSADVAIVT